MFTICIIRGARGGGGGYNMGRQVDLVIPLVQMFLAWLTRHLKTIILAISEAHPGMFDLALNGMNGGGLPEGRNADL